VVRINEILNKDIKPLYAPPRSGDIRHSLADITKAKGFGYDPKGNFRDELEEVVKWFMNNNNG
jgi:UDP-glucose 4-epimerase